MKLKLFVNCKKKKDKEKQCCIQLMKVIIYLREQKNTICSNILYAYIFLL